jgi:DNA-directed RNA polymerase specialized sigma24 family protein
MKKQPPRYPLSEQQRELVTRVRAGEPLRDAIILALQPQVQRIASACMRRHGEHSYTFERSDLVQTANAVMLERFAYALWMENPFAYLLGAAHKSMYAFFNGRSHLIKTEPASHAPLVLLSLDAPLRRSEGEEGATLAETLEGKPLVLAAPGEQEQAYVGLYQAVACLPEKQRDVIQRHYGLGEYAPESLMNISRAWSPGTASRPKSAHYHHTCAVRALSTVLSLDLSLTLTERQVS